MTSLVLNNWAQTFRDEMIKMTLTSSDLASSSETKVNIFSEPAGVIVHHSDSVAKCFNQWIDL